MTDQSEIDATIDVCPQCRAVFPYCYADLCWIDAWADIQRLTHGHDRIHEGMVISAAVGNMWADAYTACNVAAWRQFKSGPFKEPKRRH